MTRLRAASVMLPAILALAGCGGERPPGPPPSSASLRPADPPAAPGALAPRLTATADGPVLSWLEPADGGHRLVFSILRREGWAPPREVVRGQAFFANWADLPGVTRMPGGGLLAHWLAMLGEGTYAYGVRLARSLDDGESWQPLGLLHDDDSPVEHGFVSIVPAGSALRAFWLDGRAMQGERPSPMQLRTATVEGGTVSASEPLDVSTCECCNTDAALAAAGPVVAYRGRTSDEIRDILLVRWSDGAWSRPALVHADGWRIEGCPVDGPAVIADGEQVAVAWFTAAQERPRVQVAFSTDGGASFGPPMTVDERAPLGRVGLAAAIGGGAWVSWVARAGDAAEVRVVRVDRNGTIGDPRVVAATSPSRAAGFPQMEAHGGELILVWIEVGEPARLRAAALQR